jgi:VWFA-related protein
METTTHLRRTLLLLLVFGASLLAAPQDTVFKTRVDVVEVDLVASDATNRPVTDLRQDEFLVLEDGRPRSIVSFSQVHLPVLRPHPPAARDVATNTGTKDGRLLFLILDDVHTPRERTGQVKAAARRLIEQLGPQDQVAVLWMSLQKRGAREFSTNHAAVLRAIDEFSATSTRIGRRNPTEPGLPDFADLDDRPDQAVADMASSGLQGEFERARPLVMIREVCGYLTRIPHRRKALVYVGQGPAGRLFKPGASSGIDIELDVIRAMTAARRANVAMYSIGAGGLVPMESDGGAGTQDPAIPNTLGAFSRQTGGFAASGAEAEDAVERILTDTGSYYLVGYAADPPERNLVKGALSQLAGNPWQGFRRIEVRTTRPGVTIRARKGYWARDLGDSSSPPAVAAAEGAAGTVKGVLPKTDLELRAYAAPFRGASNTRHDIAVVLELASPSFVSTERGKAFADRADVAIVAVEQGERVRLSEQTAARLRLDAAKALALADGRYQMCARLALPPGQYQLRIGVRSERARQTGSVYADLTVPDFTRAPLSLGGLVLDRRAAARPTAIAHADAISRIVPFIPSLRRTFVPSDEMWAYTRAYRAPANRAGSVQLTSTIVRTTDHVNVWTTAGSSAFDARNDVEYRVLLPLDRLDAGSYRLRVTAGVPGEPPLATRELDFEVRYEAGPTETPPSTSSVARDQELDALLERATANLATYLSRFSSVVAEESYEQTVRQVSTGTGRDSFRARRLRSDFLLVRVAGTSSLTPFRDVFEVDGSAVRDRDNRLQKLFVDMPPGAMDAVRRVLNEGARYNLGSVYRNINQPMLALGFLDPDVRGGIEFVRIGAEQLDDGPAVRVDFVETGHPTVIRQAGSDRDMPSRGSLWFDPSTGSVRKMLSKTSDGLFSMESTVVFRFDQALGFPAPVEMVEHYTIGTQRIYGKAIYSNFRRFRVTTEEVIKSPQQFCP